MNRIQGPVEPGAIEKKSFAIIDSEVPEPRPFSGNEWLIVRRIIHTSADFEMLSLVKFHPDAVREGVRALLGGCLIITDTEMASMGITSRRMELLGCSVKCFMNEKKVIERAKEEGITRAAAAVDHALPMLNGNVFVVGNAPTALINLLDKLTEDTYKPALIVGMPVGFVNAAESKDQLMAQTKIPFITIKGRKGGSPLAATVVNQLAEIALEKKGQG